MASKNFWDFDPNEELIPFYKWDNTNTVSIILVKPIVEYTPRTISSQYGPGNYIEIACDNELMLLKIDSKRLRTALMTLNIKKYPAKAIIVRSGSGFDTKYTAKVV